MPGIDTNSGKVRRRLRTRATHDELVLIRRTTLQITVLFGLQFPPGSPASAASAVNVLEPLVVPQGSEPHSLSGWLATSVCDVPEAVGRLMWMLSQVPDHLSRVVQSAGAVPAIVKEPEWLRRRNLLHPVIAIPAAMQSTHRPGTQATQRPIPQAPWSDAVVISTNPPISAGKPSSRARQYLTEVRAVATGPATAIRNMVDPMWVHRFIARYLPRYFVMDERARVVRMWMREDDGVAGIELESGIVMGHVRLQFELVHRPDAPSVPHPAVTVEPVSIYLIFFRDMPGNAVRDLARKLELLDINGFVDIPSSKHMAVTPRCWYAFMSVFASSRTPGEALDGTVFRGYRLRVVCLHDAARLFAAGDDRELKKAIESHAWTW
ncbi:hypothetical protein GGF32_000788 [Allomyces javanicus]|nr:hypothetical protein GGF32_000788 [Allomyces javanicus]